MSVEHHSVELHPALAHHFDTLEQQHEAGTLGLWISLANELMLFGGLFTAYSVYRWMYPVAFAEGSRHLLWWLASLNTVILLTSSLTMALAVHAAQTGRRQSLMLFLIVTMALGATFLGIKGVEYAHKFEEGHVPGSSFHFEPVEYFRHAQVFLSLYFVMTGLHALHMVIGIGIMLWMLYWSWNGTITPEYASPIEISGLYWHFVDIVWIFLFPLLYLLGRHG